MTVQLKFDAFSKLPGMDVAASVSHAAECRNVELYSSFAQRNEENSCVVSKKTSQAGWWDHRGLRKSLDQGVQEYRSKALCMIFSQGLGQGQPKDEGSSPVPQKGG